MGTREDGLVDSTHEPFLCIHRARVTFSGVGSFSSPPLEASCLTPHLPTLLLLCSNYYTITPCLLLIFPLPPLMNFLNAILITSVSCPLLPPPLSLLLSISPLLSLRPPSHLSPLPPPPPVVNFFSNFDIHSFKYCQFVS